MKNTAKAFLTSFKAVALVALFSLVLGLASIPAKTQALDVTGSIIATPDTIQRGGSTQIKWNSFNATEVTILPGIGSVGPSGSRTVSPTQTTEYTMTMRNATDSFSISATVYVEETQNTPPTVNLTASPTHVSYNGVSTLSWNSDNATSCMATGGANNWGGSVPLDGSQSSGNLTHTTTFTITCTNGQGQSATDSATVTVDSVGNQPTVNLTADDTSIDDGDHTTLRWTSNNADYCTASGGRNGWSGSRSTSGTFNTGDLHNDTTYTIQCYNNYGSATDSVTVRVDDNNNNGNEPDVRIYANPSTVNYNGSSIITWDSDDADTCRSTGGTSGWSKSSRGRSGTFYANGITSDTTFNITCENDEGTARDSVTVRVQGTTVGNQPTVVLYADSTNVTYGGTTFIRWSTTNATSCFASGGSTGWAGTKSIGPGSFYTGSLYSARTYILTCSNNYGSSTDSVIVGVRGRTTTTTTRPPASSLVLITTSIDRNQPILPTLDNTNPRPGDEINYTVTYQNIGTGSISNLVLRLDLPYEVTYMYSTPNNPMMSGNTLIFNLGSLRANGTGTVTVRVRVRDDAQPGAMLNFPAVLSYTDPAGNPQSVSANVSAQVWRDGVLIQEDNQRVIPLGASIFGAGFWPTTLFGWLLFIILILILIALVRSLYGGTSPWQKRTVTTVEHH